jgi:hypothetical protein
VSALVDDSRRFRPLYRAHDRFPRTRALAGRGAFHERHTAVFTTA